MKLLKIFGLMFVFFTLIDGVYAKSLGDKYPSLYDNEWEKKVKLTKQQSDLIKIIRDKNQEKMNVLLMEMDTLHHEMAALVDENDAQIKAILSDKQKVKFDMYKYQLKKKNNEHRGEEKPSRKKMRVY